MECFTNLCPPRTVAMLLFSVSTVLECAAEVSTCSKLFYFSLLLFSHLKKKEGWAALRVLP